MIFRYLVVAFFLYSTECLLSQHDCLDLSFANNGRLSFDGDDNNRYYVLSSQQLDDHLQFNFRYDSIYEFFIPRLGDNHTYHYIRHYKFNLNKAGDIIPHSGKDSFQLINPEYNSFKYRKYHTLTSGDIIRENIVYDGRNHQYLERIDERLRIDSSFGVNGRILLSDDFDSYKTYRYLVTEKDEIIVFSGGQTFYGIQLKFYNSDGKNKRGVGDQGRVIIEYPDYVASIGDLYFVEHDEEYTYLIFRFYNVWDFYIMVIKINSMGELQTDFGIDGISYFELDGNSYYPRASLLDGHQNIYIVSGDLRNIDKGEDVLLSKLLPDGRLDYSFGQEGHLVLSDLIKGRFTLDNIEMVNGNICLAGSKFPDSLNIESMYEGEKAYVALIDEQGEKDYSFCNGDFEMVLEKSNSVNDILAFDDTGIIIETTNSNKRGFAIEKYRLDDVNSTDIQYSEELLNHIEIFPNPSSELISISGYDIGLISSDVNVYSIEGLLHPIRLTGSNQIDISELPPGIYILNVNLDRHQVSKKFVKH